MQLHTVHAGMFKLDGGAMFGVVPKVLWNKLNPADEENLCTWALRCLLVESGDRKILFDTGIGHKQDARFMSHFKPHGEHDLLSSLRNLGVEPGDITDVFLTHLHFDHCGGALLRNGDGEIIPTFPAARYWTSKPHLEWALEPNPRERASFLKENIVPLQDHGVLHYIDEQQDIEWIPGIRVRFVYGHTHAMMIPFINTGDQTVVFCADLLPSSFHVRMPYVMSYDIRPLETLREKAIFFEDVINGGHLLFLEHDPQTECIRLARNEKGRMTVKSRTTLSEAL